MKKLILLTGAISLFALNVSATKPEVTKTRDKWRFGYGDVYQTSTGTLNQETGELIIDQIEVNCFGGGSTKCRANSNLAVPEISGLPSYTGAEAGVAQSILDDGDDDIDAGIVSGTISTTQVFYNVSSGKSYTRTFTYSWFTNPNLSVNSQLNISDPIFF